MKQLKIAIQGVRAAFHEVAARKYFSKDQITPIECPTFKILCEALKTGEADFAMMAIENTIAGSILTNYCLLEKYQFQILGEVYLRIEMALMALPGQKIENLTSVQSHPMALHQCEDFLHQHPQLKILESNDTAESAKIISISKEKGLAAIASALAAKTYGLEILAPSIETNKKNYTRFLVLAKDKMDITADANKASIRFQIPHKPGSLVDTLAVLNNHQINMTKIQSVPILGTPYEYGFHVDLEWDDTKQYTLAMEALKSQVINLIHFGAYPKGDKGAL